MSRRSSRLVSRGYYNSDEESDSSSVTNISYRENPVKVFKKKAGTRKSYSGTPTRANSNASSTSPEASITADLYDGLNSPSPSISQSPPTMRTVPYVSAIATPRPALTLSSARSQTPTRCPSVPLGKSPHAGLSGSSRSGMNLTPNHKELSQSGVNSSGYSSSEGPHRKSTGSSSRIPGNSGAQRTGYRMWISSAFLCLMDSISLMIIPVQSKIMHLATSASTAFSSRMKKACGLFLLLLITLLCLWFLLPLLISLASRMSVTKTPSQTKSQSQPVIADTPPPPPLSTMHLTPVVDPAVVHAALEEKKQRVMEELQLKYQELQLKQEKLLSQMTERLQLDIQDMKSKLEAVDSNSRLHLNWLTDRIKEQDDLRLFDKGSCSDCGRPMADRMADFALETQGASVISTRCSETYHVRSACVTLFGFPLWYPSESPRTVIQGYPVLLPGKCWAFHGVQGTLVISLSHPIMITHVTLDHLPRYNSPTGRIDSAPKDFEVYGMKNDTEEGTLLGTFTYNENGESTQTFKLPDQSDAVYRFVELRVLTNWGHVEYTCLYRFRVHGQMLST